MNQQMMRMAMAQGGTMAGNILPDGWDDHLGPPPVMTSPTVPRSSGSGGSNPWANVLTATALSLGSIFGRQPINFGQQTTQAADPQAAQIQALRAQGYSDEQIRAMLYGTPPPGGSLTGSIFQRGASLIGVSTDTFTMLLIGGIALWALPSFRKGR